MFYKGVTGALAFAGFIALPTAASAMGGGVGCPDLPEYARAVGTLEGIGACGMTVEEARKVVAREQGQPVADPAAPAPRHSSKRHHHRTKKPQM